MKYLLPTSLMVLAAIMLAPAAGALAAEPQAATSTGIVVAVGESGPNGLVLQA